MKILEDLFLKHPIAAFLILLLIGLVFVLFVATRIINREAEEQRQRMKDDEPFEINN